MIDVLVVDDSLVARDLLVYILKSDREINVIGVVKNGKEAIDFLKVAKPNVITMDINMPVMDGIEATKYIMATNPIPIIVVSSHWSSKDVDDSFNALKIGAMAIAEKPAGFGNPRFNEMGENLINLVKLFSNAKMKDVLRKTTFAKPKRTTSTAIRQNEKVKIVCIGASTGGPVVIEKILSNLSVPFSVPIIIVQHIIPGFVEGFVEWLNHSSKIPVKLAADGELLTKNCCYVAPDFCHTSVTSEYKISLQNKPPINGLKPSISFFFSSVLNSFGSGSLAILLSGMGRDGALELKKLKEAGVTTIVQNEETSVVFGMPGEAVKLNAVTHIYSPEEIFFYLNTQLNV